MALQYSDYDFDEIVPRRGTNSYKWDSHPELPDVLPMWVADMDFKTAPAVIEALRRRVEQGVFGYTRVPDAYYDAVIDWFASRHGFDIPRDSIIYTSGVVPAVSAVIKALAEPGDKVIVQTPVYNCFFSSIRNNGCVIEENRLISDGDSFAIDFEDLEAKAADPAARLLLLCNPHNPVGRVWSREELTRIGEICMRNGVTVISDEIHCELVYPPYRYTPYGSISREFLEASVTCCSPSKAFNTAGLQIANIIAADADMRQRIDRAININEVCDVNPFGVEGLIAAYRKGAEWLGDLIEYLHGNYRYLLDRFAADFPQLKVTCLEATYLVWVDIRALGMSSAQLEDFLIEKGRVWLNAGTVYGDAGEGYMRINIACPRSTLVEGLDRMARALSTL